MQAAYQYDYYKPMRNLMKGLLGDCLKDGPFLHRAVLTGILRVAKEDIFSELNNPGIYGVLKRPTRRGLALHNPKSNSCCSKGAMLNALRRYGRPTMAIALVVISP